MKQYFDFTAFGKAIKTKRTIDNNLGVRDVAKKIKSSAATVSRMERGKDASLITIISTCNWLGKSISEFVKTKK